MHAKYGKWHADGTILSDLGLKTILFHSCRVMLRFKRAIIWLRRIGHGRGFGVQSPNDYYFLRNVINEHIPYYKYDDLKEVVTCENKYSRKMCQLCFRLSNHAQADFFLEINANNDAVREYVLAACKKTKAIKASLPADLPDAWQGKTFFVWCAYSPGIEPLVSKVVELSGERSVIVVDQIYENRETQDFWNAMADDNHITIAYDLYHSGILLKESRRYKKKYFVNF